jgi:beta-glucosidase
VYGQPTPPQPTLAAISSSTLADGTFTVRATLRNPTSRPLSAASMSMSVPSGWTLSPAGQVSLGAVAPGGSASKTFSVTAPSSGLTAGTENLLATATYRSAGGGGAEGGPGGAEGGPGGGEGGPGGANSTLINAAQVQVPAASLAATYNNTGITADADPDPSSAFIGFDGIGTSYSAEGLADGGLTPGASVSSGGLEFTWPDVAAAEPDNTMAEGQTIAISGSGASLGFLAAANNSAESGTGTIYYTDGTTQSFTLNVGNFWYPSGEDGNPDNVQVAGVDYANYPTGSSGHEVYVFEQSVPLAAGKTVEAVTLPSLGSVAGYNAALHIFAMAIG